MIAADELTQQESTSTPTVEPKYRQRSMTVRSKVALVVLIAIMLISAVSIIGITSVQSNASAAQRLTEIHDLTHVADQQVVSRNAIESNLARLRRSLAGDQSIDVFQMQISIELATKKLTDSALNGASPDDSLTLAMAAIAEPSDRFVVAVRQAVQLSATDPEAALQAIGLAEASSAELAEAQTKLITQFEQTIAVRRAALEDARSQSLLLLRWGSFAAVIILVSAGWLLRRSLVRPLAEIGHVARQLSRRNFDPRVSRMGTDEIGSIASSINGLASSVSKYMAQISDEYDHSQYGRKLTEEFERVSTEQEVLGVIATAMSVIDESVPMELLTLDTNKSHVLVRGAVNARAGDAGCSVNTPYGCAAMRHGHHFAFEDSRTADCPKLRERRGPSVAAVCVPVKAERGTIGVIHAVTRVDQPLGPASVSQMETLALQSGIRIQDARQRDFTEKLATIDGLTGLRNRRSIEEELRRALNGGGQMCVVLADIDHFKKLNDTAGHEQGDRALQHFSRTMESTFRETDRCGRFGGEEFVIVLPGANLGVALEVVHRFRENLARSSVEAGLPMITASFGIVDNNMAQSLESILRLADIAMYRAKQEGRNRAVIADNRDIAVLHEGVGSSPIGAHGLPSPAPGSGRAAATLPTPGPADEGRSGIAI